MPARKLIDLATPKARKRLPALPHSKPHWLSISAGRFLGYRSGAWLGRIYLAGRYLESPIGTADDGLPADGEVTLSYAQALRAAIAWCDEQEGRGRGGARLRGPYAVAHAAAEYLAWYRAHRKAAGDAEQRVRRAILPDLGGEEVEALTVRRLRQWHQALGTSPASMRPGKEVQKVREVTTPEAARKRKATANRNLTTLKALLNFAVAEGRVAPGAAAAWKGVKPFKGADAPQVRYLGEEEVRRLLNACEPDFRRLVTAALLTGCRYGELAGLAAADYRPDSRSLQVSGKSGPRVVFLNEEGAAFFGSLAAGREATVFLLLTASGRSWMRSDQVRRMDEALAIAKIPKPASFHTLRHTYASHYLMAGGGLPGLAQQLGHADTRMTLRHYAHLASAWRAEEVQRFGPRLGLAEAREGGALESIANHRRTKEVR